MKSYFTRNINKLSLIAVLIVVAVTLTSCRQGSWPTTVYTTWGREFKFGGFFSALFGWPVAILSYPIAFLMSTIGGWLGNSYAWGLIFTTFIVRTCAWPIYAKQNDSSIKMQLIQPETERIQRKYQGRKDPESQRRMQMETMALYKKYKMNPFGCIFTMIMQFPIFMAMYEVVRRINLTATKVIAGTATTITEPGRFSLSNTKLFGFFELNTSFNDAVLTRDKIFGMILAIAFGAVTIISQKLAQKQPSYVKKRPSASQSGDAMAKQMKIMNYVMTGMFIIMSLSSTSLALYWLVGGVYQLFQSAIGRKRNEKNYYKMKEKI